MNAFKYVVFFVEDIVASKKFYSELLECTPQELSPTFVSYELDSGLALELWQRDKVQPPASLTGGGTELALSVPDPSSLNRLFHQWKEKGIAFAQSPASAVFGLTFVALDPDGHRLRVIAPK